MLDEVVYMPFRETSLWCEHAYRVILVVWQLGWVDLDIKHHTFSLDLLGLMGLWLAYFGFFLCLYVVFAGIAACSVWISPIQIQCNTYVHSPDLA